MNIAVILSAGVGSRMKNVLPKQFIEVDNKPVFLYTLEKFLLNKNIDKIILVINKDFADLYEYYLNKYSINNVELVNGGNTRQLSTFNALSYLKDKCASDDIILIHDGARPLITQQIIDENISLCQKNKNPVVTVINIVDTIVDKEYNLLDRNNLLSVQTPQTFIFDQIYSIHQKCLDDGIINPSDDAQLAKNYGHKITYANGSRLNIKITEPEDLKLFQYLQKEGD